MPSLQAIKSDSRFSKKLQNDLGCGIASLQEPEHVGWAGWTANVMALNANSRCFRDDERSRRAL
jgi:hypothetical protein